MKAPARREPAAAHRAKPASMPAEVAAEQAPPTTPLVVNADGVQLAPPAPTPPEPTPPSVSNGATAK